jgi:hypothetical protein
MMQGKEVVTEPSSSESGSEEEDDDDDPPFKRPRGRQRRPAPAPRHSFVVKKEPKSDDELGRNSDDDASELDENFDPGRMSEDEGNMGETGGPYSIADLRVVGKFIASVEDWQTVQQSSKWVKFAEKVQLLQTYSMHHTNRCLVVSYAHRQIVA